MACRACPCTAPSTTASSRRDRRAARNAGRDLPAEALDTVLRRGGKVPGGWCGYYGACGAAVGVGVAVSA